MLARDFTLIKAPPVDANRVVAAFTRLVDQIQARDDCSRLEALQRASDEHTAAFEEYLKAFDRR
jgi:hypothetical protein